MGGCPHGFGRERQYRGLRRSQAWRRSCAQRHRCDSSRTAGEDCCAAFLACEMTFFEQRRRLAVKWITRSDVKVDRVACPWLIRRFVDPEAEFLFVPEDQLLEAARREEAIP